MGSSRPVTRPREMILRHFRALLALSFAVIAAIAAVSSIGAAKQLPSTSVPVDRDDIAGVVTGNNGPEAGVWVIAETTDLPTKFAKIVVTDERGRYLVPDLPNARYSLWVRGYGLVDSGKAQAAPGMDVDL